MAGQGKLRVENNAGTRAGGAEHGDEQVIRGIIAGGLWGAVIGAVLIALTSQLAEWRDLSPAVTVEQSEAETVPEVPAASVDRVPEVASAGERAPRVAVATPRVDAGAADEITAPMLDTAPPTAPAAGTPPGDIDAAVETAGAPAAPAPVQTPEDAPAVAIAMAPEADAPPTPGEPALAPASSAPDAQADVAAPVGPDPAEDTPSATPSVPDEAPVIVAEAPAAAADAPVFDGRPAEPTAPEPVAEAPEVEPAPVPEPVETAEAAPAPEAHPETTESAGIAMPEAEPEPEPEIEVAAPESAPVAVEGANGGSAGNDEPQIMRIANEQPSLPGRRVSKLPTVGAGNSGDETDVAAEPAEEEASVPSEMSALEGNREPFEAPEGAALIAVVLIHEDGPALIDGADSGLPVTMAVRASLPDAGQLAKAYREAGREVVLIPDLPPRARAQDVETALPVNLRAMPQAVAVMDARGDGFQDDRGATASVVARVAETGHGLLTWSRGFNTAQKLAEEEGVPSALVYRGLDSSDPAAVARALDQAAFRARQGGGIVLVGPAEAGVIEGLEIWRSDARRTDTVLAPLSTILLGG
jgi:polysaccharide deacetylase 2 family uncharacterized protein YibQ